MMKNTLTLWWISSLVLAPSGAQMVGDVFENVEGYIMDRFCIEVS